MVISMDALEWRTGILLFLSVCMAVSLCECEWMFVCVCV